MEKDHGISGKFRSREEVNIWARRKKLKNNLLVAILRDGDVLRHNLHVLASPKHKENKGFNLVQSKHPKSHGLKPKTKENKGEEKHTKLLHETTSIMSLKRGLRSDYNEGFRPKQPPSPSLLIWRLDLTLTLLNLELKA